MESERSLEGLLQELSPEQRERVRGYAEYLLAGPPERSKAGTGDGPGPEAEVTLREITSETVYQICRLSDTLTPPKKFMVAQNAVSIAQAHFEPHAWFRAVYADETPVGFIMLYDSPEEKEYFLWRFMIAEPHHGKGFGRRALELLIDYVRTRPDATVLETSCGQGAGSPEGFYERLGFRRNGKIIDDEVVMELVL
ncbi:MAG: GNAT family N-acetyltransferase [Anaerolineae bacterium]|jgi:diamine N-acetyltransferase|nr:GNAT family N-acetyltransferase [Anaerolineae bacterium]